MVIALSENWLEESSAASQPVARHIPFVSILIPKMFGHFQTISLYISKMFRKEIFSKRTSSRLEFISSVKNTFRGLNFSKVRNFKDGKRSEFIQEIGLSNKVSEIRRWMTLGNFGGYSSIRWFGVGCEI